MDYMPDAVERERRERLALGPKCRCGHYSFEHASMGTEECLRLASKDPFIPCPCKKPKYETMK